MFTGDIVEYHSACYCGDGHFADWGGTLEAIAAFDPAPSPRAGAMRWWGARWWPRPSARTTGFHRQHLSPAARVAARGGTLKEAWDAVRAACDPKFKDFAIYEHCLPFNVARAYDEARGIDTPRIWTAAAARQRRADRNARRQSRHASHFRRHRGHAGNRHPRRRL
jgi:hypothetical protein